MDDFLISQTDFLLVRAEIQTLRTENAKLQEALEQIANASPTVSSDNYVTTCLQADAFLNVQYIARQAIAKEK